MSRFYNFSSRNGCILVFLGIVFLLVIFYNLDINGEYRQTAKELTKGPEDVQLLVTIPSLGQVQGFEMLSTTGRKIAAFRGIPYAKPPVGDLRFKEPVTVEPWAEQIFDATKQGPSCMITEDCLILNIYTHSNVTVLKPVMVYIHGGSFQRGSGNDYGPINILNRDVVLVTINYRLSAFGFFTTGDSEAPGNYGLFDQTLALKWVQDYIEHFGGNPKSVTIFGNSAGGASVVFHILSPHSKGLFHRAIAQSGSALCPWATLQPNIIEYSKLLAKDLNCTGSSQEKMACLRNKKYTEFTRIIGKRWILTPFFPMMMFGPRVDSERESPFLPADPRDLIKEKKFNAVPFIAGLTPREGDMWTSGIWNNGNGRSLFKKDPVGYIPVVLGFELHKDRRAIAQKIIAHFFNSSQSFDNQLSEMGDMFSDYLFNKAVDESVHLLSRYSDYPVYYYLYSHGGGSHTAEKPALFFRPSNPDDVKMSKMLVDLWTSFATIGVPRSDLVEDEWLPLDPESEETRYLKITSSNTNMIDGSMPFIDRLAFWDGLL